MGQAEGDVVGYQPGVSQNDGDATPPNPGIRQEHRLGCRSSVRSRRRLKHPVRLKKGHLSLEQNHVITLSLNRSVRSPRTHQGCFKNTTAAVPMGNPPPDSTFPRSTEVALGFPTFSSPAKVGKTKSESKKSWKPLGKVGISQLRGRAPRTGTPQLLDLTR